MYGAFCLIEAIVVFSAYTTDDQYDTSTPESITKPLIYRSFK